MQSKAKDVTTYIEEAPVERQEVLRRLRELCLAELTGFEETMDYAGASYKRNGEVEVGFASQKHFIGLYILRTDVMAAHKDRLHGKGISVGKGAIRYSKPERIDFDVVCLFVQRGKALELAFECRVAFRVEASRYPTQFGRQLFLPLCLRSDLATNLRQFLHRGLAPRDLSLEFIHLLPQCLALLLELLELRLHAVELFQSCGEVFSVHRDGLELLIEAVVHRAIMLAEGPLARGAHAVIPEVNDAIAMGFDVLVLRPQGVTLRDGFLAVPYPFRVP